MRDVQRRTVDLRVAAARLGIPRSTAYRLAAAGRFPVPVISAGRRLYVPVAPLEAILAGDQDDPVVGLDEAAAELDRIYAAVDALQRPGYDRGHPLHRVDAFALELERAMTHLGRAMAALREHDEGLRPVAAAESEEDT